MSTRFFVLHLDEPDHRPAARTRYEIQVLDREGRAEHSIYIDENGTIVAVEKNEPVTGPSPTVPRAVIEAALRQPKGQGDYVDATGSSMAPF